jgi:hypothetical protein
VALAACGSSSASHTSTTASTGTGSTAGHTSTTLAPTASGPLHFSPLRPLAQGTGLASISCTATTSCIALDDTGRGYHYDGTTWSAPVPPTGQALGPGAISVSCATPSLCMAVATASSQVVSWNGQGWSAPVTLDGAMGLEAVGCASTGYCAAVDAEGNAFATDGQGWQGTSGDWGSVSSISCVSSSFCMSTSGGISQWNGSSWTQPAQFGTASSLTGVSCPSASFCMAVDQTGQSLEWNGQAWSAPASVEPAGVAGAVGAALTGVSCPTTSFCAAVDSQGGVLQWSGGTWTRTDVDATRKLTAVSCPSPALCVVVDQSGDVSDGTP